MGSLGADRAAAGAERAFPGATGHAGPIALPVGGPDTKADAAPDSLPVGGPDTKAVAGPIALAIASQDTKADAAPLSCPVGGRLVVMRVSRAALSALGGYWDLPWAHAD